MAKRKSGVGNPTNRASELVEYNSQLEERIRILELELESSASPRQGELVEDGEADSAKHFGSGGEASDAGVSGGEASDAGVSGGADEEVEALSGRTPGVWVNDEGNTCIGRECMITEARPEGLFFKLDPDSCDPKTRELFVNAMIRGARTGLKT